MVQTELMNILFWQQRSMMDTTNVYLHNHNLPNTSTNEEEKEEKGKEKGKGGGLYAHILKEEKKQRITTNECSPTRNRYGRIYVSGRPLLLEDRMKILELHLCGLKKINIAKQLGVTHSCVSKVLRRFMETGSIVSRNSRSASCSFPNETKRESERMFGLGQITQLYSARSEKRKLPFTIENLLASDMAIRHYYTSLPSTI